MPATGTPESPMPLAWMSEQLAGYIGKLGQVWVEGELTAWKVSRGNVYAKLRDVNEDVSMSLNVWGSTLARLEGEFAQGDRVVALVKPDFWKRGGQLSLRADDVRHVGLGNLLAQLERLRTQLREEGLFDAARKQPIPFLPGTVGLITGKGSDAEQDVLRNARMRWPDVHFRIEHAAVQGDNCVPTVLTALKVLDADPEVDVIIIARGGGDFLHLLPFSDERLVRAVAAAKTPIVSAIGHEPDHPLLDDVADLRASTPTDAAKRIVPDIAEEHRLIAEGRMRLNNWIDRWLDAQFERVEMLRNHRALTRPEQLVEREADDVARLIERADSALDRLVTTGSNELERLVASHRALSPQHTLDRGYAVVRDAEGRVLRDAAELSPGDGVLLSLARGRAAAEIVATQPAG